MPGAIRAEFISLLAEPKNGLLSFTKTIVQAHAYNAITKYQSVPKFQKQYIIKHQQITRFSQGTPQT